MSITLLLPFSLGLDDFIGMPADAIWVRVTCCLRVAAMRSVSFFDKGGGCCFFVLFVFLEAYGGGFKFVFFLDCVLTL